ncbi:hypothetical protein KQI59_04505, partial [Streptomyces sp. Vc17.3-30]|nr:hypothetical protein [Streptomyces sp. Vc17.3-30]
MAVSEAASSRSRRTGPPRPGASGPGVWPAVSAAGAVALAALVAGGVRAGLPGRRTASGQARDQSPYRC